MNLFPVSQKASLPWSGCIHPQREKVEQVLGDLETARKSCFSRGRGREFTPSLISSQVMQQLTPGTCIPSPDLIPLGFKSLWYSVPFALSYVNTLNSHNGLQTRSSFLLYLNKTPATSNKLPDLQNAFQSYHLIPWFIKVLHYSFKNLLKQWSFPGRLPCTSGVQIFITDLGNRTDLSCPVHVPHFKWVWTFVWIFNTTMGHIPLLGIQCPTLSWV